MDTADVSVNLLTSQNESEARELARVIEAHNRRRQKIENEIMEEAEAIINREINFKEQKIIVIAKDNWHPGVLGIVASKLVDRFYRPVIVISSTKDLCKGSGRSIKNFHLFNALSECSDLLETFGGHSHAAGIVIARDSIEAFKNNINRLAQERLFFEDLIPSLDIDMELMLSDLNEKIILELDVLEPFGTANPEPLFFTRNLRLKGMPQILSRNTLKLWVTDGSITYQAIGFGMGNLHDSFRNADCFDLVYTPRIDNWHGAGNILLEIRDIFFR
jgi:single-stranded-DNA-specific exonuclease